jgi:hypothetical protein
MPLLLIFVNAALVAALAVWVVRLRAHGRHLAHDVTELSRTVAAMQGWAAQELRALRHEFTVARVDASAAEVEARLEKQRAASLAAAPSELAALEPPATSEKAPGVAVAALEEEEPTTFWTGTDAARVRTEAEAGGAPRPPQATPRAALLVAVAPPASAPPFPSPEAGILAAGLGRPKSARVAPRPPTGVSTAPTLVSMQAQGKVSASPGRPPEPDEDEPRDTLAMLAPASPRWSSHEDGEATTLFDPNPPTYARLPPISPPAPLADPDLIGSEDIAEEAARLHLGPDEPTPPRRGRAALFLPAYEASKAGSA